MSLDTRTLLQRFAERTERRQQTLTLAVAGGCHVLCSHFEPLRQMAADLLQPLAEPGQSTALDPVDPGAAATPLGLGNEGLLRQAVAPKPLDESLRPVPGRRRIVEHSLQKRADRPVWVQVLVQDPVGRLMHAATLPRVGRVATRVTGARWQLSIRACRRARASSRLRS